MIALMIGFVIGGWFGFSVAAVLVAGRDDRPGTRELSGPYGADFAGRRAS